MDKFSAEVRSRIMSQVKPTANRTTEWRLRAILISSSVNGWSLGTASDLPGRPDFIFKKKSLSFLSTAVFGTGVHSAIDPPSPIVNFGQRKSPGTKLGTPEFHANFGVLGGAWRVFENVD